MSAPHIIEPRRTGLDTLERVQGAARALASLPARLHRYAELVANRVHAEEDTFAQAEGWQITRTRWGGRKYRHPGFPRQVDQ